VKRTPDPGLAGVEQAVETSRTTAPASPTFHDLHCLSCIAKSRLLARIYGLDWKDDSLGWK
jgi:hypothetical protein